MHLNMMQMKQLVTVLVSQLEGCEFESQVRQASTAGALNKTINPRYSALWALGDKNVGLSG